MADPTRKQALVAELAAARSELAAHATGVRRGFSVVEKVKRGVRHHPVVWFGGAILLGLLLSRNARQPKAVKVPVFREKKVEKAGKAALALTVLKFGLDMARPMLLRWVRNRVVSGAMRRPQEARGRTAPGARTR